MDGLVVMPSIAEDMISHENDSLRDRVADLDKKVQEQQDEILCLRSALADVLRRVSNLEMQKASAIADNSPRRGGGTSRPSSVPAGARRSSESSPTSVYAVHRTNSPRHVQSTKPQASSIKKWASSSEVPSGPASPAKRNGSITNLFDSGRMSPAPYPKGRNSSSGSLQSLSNLSDAGRTKSPTHSPSYNRSSAPLFRPFAASQFKGPAREPVYHEGDGYLRMFLRGRALNLYSPSDLGEYDVTKALLPPNEKLKIEWVYGYRGRDCRNNLFLLPTGEMVYFVAAVVVLYNVDEQMQRHYLGHTDDVKCIAMHPNKLYIASGQVAGIDRREKKEENGIDQVQMSYMPHIRIWDSVSLHTLHVIGIAEFDRAVCCVGFSKADGGQYLCAVDEANEHILSIWDWHKGERGCKIAESKSAGDPVLACEFHPLDKNVIVTCGKNHINFWSLEANALNKKVGIFEKYDKPKYVLCIAFDDNGNCLSGDSNGSIIVWGRGSNKIVKVLLGAHDGGIFSLCVCKDGSIVSGGGKDRMLAVWDSNFQQKVKSYELSETLGPVRTIAQGKGNMLIVGTTKNHIIQGTVDLKFSVIVQGHVDELWGLAVHPNHHQFVSCGYDRQIFFWDTLTHTTIWSKEIQDGAHAAGFHPNGNMVAIATLSARWLVLDLLTREVITTCTDGNESLSCISYSPDGRFIAIGSRDNHIYIYQVSEEGRKYNRVGRCAGHSSFVLHIDWSTDSQFLQSNSGDYEILLWSAAVCRQITQPSSMRDIEWASQTCTLGFNVCGIWPEGSDGTDVNSCARAHGKDLLATGDDYGKVKLFTYPCNKPKSAFHYYGGHSSHVTNVQFLYNDMRLISMGGKDMSIMQWQVV